MRKSVTCMRNSTKKQILTKILEMLEIETAAPQIKKYRSSIDKFKQKKEYQESRIKNEKVLHSGRNKKWEMSPRMIPNFINSRK
jgi:hypothetical protein